jgi:ubiquinone/menaquinone biosynthesis C-methylase UbiE
MISKKIELKGISNAFITRGVAEELPFPDCFFVLIVGNNGINNVKDEYQVLSECRRVLEENGQMVLTMNLPYTFVEFYEIFEEVLLERGMTERTGNLKDHIFTKRKPVEYWKEAIEKAGFKIRSVNVDGFKMKFTDGNAFLEHNFIRAAFRKPWEKVASDPEIWQAIADKLNRVAAANGELTMSVPFACFDCYKS